MSTRLDNYAQHHNVRWVSLKTFEILHYARHSRPEGKGWTRRWVKEQTRKRTSTAELPGGLHDVEDSVESGARSRKGGEGRGSTLGHDGDGSLNRRPTMHGEGMKSLENALLKSHQRGQSASHHRSDSASKSKKIVLALAHSQTPLPGSLPSSVPGTARAVGGLLSGEEDDSLAGIV